MQQGADGGRGGKSSGQSQLLFAASENKKAHSARRVGAVDGASRNPTSLFDSLTETRLLAYPGPPAPGGLVGSNHTNTQNGKV